MGQLFDKLFWKVLPFLAVGILAALILFGKKGMWNALPILLIFLFGGALPVFAEISNFLHIHLLRKQAALGQAEAIPRLKRAQCSVGKWARVFAITWIAGVLAALGLMLHKGLSFSHQVPSVPQPPSLSPGSSTYSLLVFLTWNFYLSGLAGAFFMLSMGLVFLRVLFTWKKRPVKRLPKSLMVLLILFVVSFANLFVSAFLTKRIIRNNVVLFLQSAPPDARVSIDFDPVADPNRFIAALSEVTSYPAHHSHAMKSFEVRIEANEQTLTLQAGPDSSRENEYWIFFPGFRSSPLEIGRINTDILNNIPEKVESTQ